MRRFIACGLLLLGSVVGVRASQGANIEEQVTALVAQPKVTLVHFWAPWCSNCKREMRPDGWAKFVSDNPDVTVVFINVWHGGLNDVRELSAAGLGKQPNFVAITHPNESRKAGEKLEKFLGLPVAWVPTTWVFREGRQRYALNYGEVRFEMLQQMVEDAARKW
jgi:thiol-disulfide isomerase/thioredoxin